MKTIKIITGTLIAMLFAASIRAGNNDHKLHFVVKGWENKVIYKGFYYGENPYISLNKLGKKDSVTADSKGAFDFAGDSVLAPGVYFALTKDNKSRLEYIIDKEQHFTIESDTNGSIIANAKVKGSEENAIFYAYQKYLIQEHNKDEKAGGEKNKVMHDSIGREVSRYCDNIIVKYKDMFLSKLLLTAEDVQVPPSPKLPDGKTDSTFPYRYYRTHYFNNIDFTDGRLVRSPVFFPHIKFFLEKLIPQDPDSIIAAADYLISMAHGNKEMFKFLVSYITNTYEVSNIMGMDKVFVHMARKYYTSNQAYWVSAKQLEHIQERAAQWEPILLGQRAPTLTLPDSANVMQTMDSIHANYTILYFWDYDCGHCQMETPKLIKWYDSIKGEGVEVYAIEDNEKDLYKWKEYVRQHKLDWINVSDIFHTGTFRHDFDVIATPTMYVLDADKRIIAKKVNTEELDKIIRHDMEKHPDR